MAPPPRSRLHPSVANVLRDAISEAQGVEVFAIGDVEEGVVIAAQVTCRGRADRVNALIDRPKAGQVVIHNHPSGNLQPSDADMQLAHIYGENGVGFIIVDSQASRSNWVVEPHRSPNPSTMMTYADFSSRDSPKPWTAGSSAKHN